MVIDTSKTSPQDAAVELCALLEAAGKIPPLGTTSLLFAPCPSAAQAGYLGLMTHWLRDFQGLQ